MKVLTRSNSASLLKSGKNRGAQGGMEKDIQSNTILPPSVSWCREEDNSPCGCWLEQVLKCNSCSSFEPTVENDFYYQEPLKVNTMLNKISFWKDDFLDC